MSIIITDSSHVSTYNYNVDITNLSKRNIIHLTVTDKRKYAYEVGSVIPVH